MSDLPVVRDVSELRAAVSAWRGDGLRVGFVPTMGALHDGHLSLLEIARRRADRVVASIFVNPTQFGPGEDFDAYPRGESRDAALLAGAGCDLLFAPDAAEMYPEGFATAVHVAGLTDCLCGLSRPGHFAGVATVVAKLLNQARPDVAVFGEKDYQQLQVIRRVNADLDLGAEIVGAPTLREPDGLAMSSRNRYLDEPARAIAGRLNVILRSAAAALANGARVDETLAEAEAALRDAGFDAVDYVDVRAADGLSPQGPGPASAPSRVFAAAHVGGARLIDNWPVDAPAPTRRPAP